MIASQVIKRSTVLPKKQHVLSAPQAYELHILPLLYMQKVSPAPGVCVLHGWVQMA